MEDAVDCLIACYDALAGLRRVKSTWRQIDVGEVIKKMDKP